MPTVGKRCSCGFIHLAKTFKDRENLTPKQRTQIFYTSHRLFESSYYGTLEIPSKKIYLEFYDKIHTTLREVPKEEASEEKEEPHCLLCGKPISEEESEEFQGYHRNCFYIEEIQDSDDM